MSQQPASLRRPAVPVALVVALVVAAACLVAIAPRPATGDSGAAALQRWSGYKIPATGRAAGGWIGGYRVDGTTVFVTTPAKKPNRVGYSTPREVGDVPGRAASRAETARAAWILSKYGAYRDATQAAAVDASVYHLLVGGAWRITKPRGARRIRQSGDGASVRRFARIMLRQSRASAGRYTAQLTATTADVGGTVAVTVAVTDGHGRPAAGLPVTLAMSGAEAMTSVTGDDGRAVGRFAATARGWQQVTATVRKVPEHRLHLWLPEKKSHAAAAEGGARRELVVTQQTPVRGPQTLSLAADPGQLVVGSTARVLATVGGDAATRTARAALHGPFASATAVHCSGSAVGAVSAPVADDGTYALPGVSVSGGGYYAWRVAVDGTETSVPVAACGATVKVRSRAVTSMLADPNPVSPTEVGAWGTVAGLPFPEEVTLTATLAGPYGSADEAAQSGCSSLPGNPVANDRTGNGSIHFTVPRPPPGSYYAWQVQASAGDLWLGSRSPCAAQGSVILIQ